MAEGSVLVPNTAGGFPVDGFGVTAPAALTAGQAIRQAIALGDSVVAGNVAKIDANGNQLIIAYPIGGPFIPLPAIVATGVALGQGPTGVEIVVPQGSGSVTYAISQTPTPVVPTLAASTTGGTLAAGTEFVRVAYVTAAGESPIPSPEASVAVTGTTASVVVTSPAAATNATGYNVYVSNATGTELLANGATPVAIGTNYTITANPSGTAAFATRTRTTPPATAATVNDQVNLATTSAVYVTASTGTPAPFYRTV